MSIFMNEKKNAEAHVETLKTSKGKIILNIKNKAAGIIPNYKSELSKPAWYQQK
jgi:hypothetical protein